MWNNVRLVNWLANGLITLALTAFVLAGLWWLVQRPAFDLVAVQVEAVPGERLQRVSEAGVRTAVAGRLQGNFFTLNLEDARQLFETVPWVQQAQVRRVWPNQLEVKVREYQPLAIWNDDQLVDVAGRTFEASTAEAESEGLLPRLSGPSGAGQIVVRRYADLVRWLQPLDRWPVRVTLSSRLAWQVELDNGLVLELGRDPELSQTRVAGTHAADEQQLSVQRRVTRFVRLLPNIEQQSGQVVRQADLRYPDGFALRLERPAGTPSRPSSPSSRAERP